ncbi:hypothetical protein Trco_008226 [Trichoderma cornu-damae]|uniref:Uncharacterized protein n=1 Tax=Trichoderma cornu-damae TaxID=654480 RepID=A0A9P8QF91_9HYPO|nr:hypothetical protein Trco_008226 [Trichoderma cornu-damae]
MITRKIVTESKTQLRHAALFAEAVYREREQNRRIGFGNMGTIGFQGSDAKPGQNPFLVDASYEGSIGVP